MTVDLISSAEHGVPWVNASGLPVDLVESSVREVATQLSRWVSDSRRTNSASMFNRTAYVAPDNPFAQMRIARGAVHNDEIVGGLADATEGLIFQGVQWESSVADEADIFNQMAARQNLDDLLRQAYRALYTDSQVVFATWWDFQEFKLRGRNSDKVTGPDGTLAVRRGPQRRKSYQVYCPTQVTVLDSMKVVPVGNRMWGQDKLAWQASRAEFEAYAELALDPALASSDPTMLRLFLGQYTPSRVEADSLAAMGVDPDYLLEFNPQFVWRHTLTKPSYAQFPDIRLASVFKLLDLKQQLMEADRVNLVGAANYILLVKKGSDQSPAQQPEIDNLKENFSVIARLPVIISDHRLNIEIITPSQDIVLQEAKYDTLDRRILSRIIGALTVSNNLRADTALTLSRGIARLLENRRHMLKRTLEAHIARAVVDHPENAFFKSEPNLAFTPRNVQLDADSQVVQAVLALRTQKELSRKSLLEFFGFDQEVEAQRRETEAEQYDPIFKTVVPFSSPALNGDAAPEGEVVAPQVTGARGGRPAGGGEPPANAANPQPRNRTPQRQAAQAETAQADPPTDQA